MYIREMEEKDIAQVAELFNALVYYIKQTTKDPYFDFTDDQSFGFTSYLKDDILDNPQSRVVVAVDGGRVVGFFLGEITRCFLPISSCGSIGYISAAFLIRKFRGRGLGRQKKEHLDAFFYEKGIRFIDLNVLSGNNQGKKSWESLGFTTYREQMRRDLKALGESREDG